MKKSFYNGYYGLYGTNGIGIFTNWDICQRETKFAGQYFMSKKFENYEDAYKWVIDNYELLIKKYNYTLRLNIPEELPLNFFVLTKKMRIPPVLKF
jgi:viroplasmin and RNaseH domain-containing protein